MLLRRGVPLLAVLLFPLAVRAEITIFYPPAKSLLKTDKVTVEGFIKNGRPGQKVEIRVAGRTYKTISSPGGVRFSETITLTPGVNAFSFVDSADGKAADLDVFYADGKKSPNNNYIVFMKHAALDDGCESCHKESGGKWELEKKPPDSCYECHDNYKEKKPVSVHSPIQDGDCTSCHPVHYAPQKKLLAKAVPGLCLDCHDDMAKDKDGKQWAAPHAAMDDGCLVCHAAHVSGAKKLLGKAVPDLCFECHDNVMKQKDGKDWPAPHDPVGSGDCLACHKAHGSPVKKILAAPVPALCKDCHDDVTKNAEGEAWTAPHSPVDDGDCSACHAVHGSVAKKLLKSAVPILCNECHDDTKIDKATGKTAAVVHSPVEDNDCGGCHRIHGSEVKGILKAKVPELCLECHDNPMVDAKQQEWDTPHPPVQEGQCSVCHSAHSSSAKGLLIATYNEVCYKCHSAHSHPLKLKETYKRKVEIPKGVAVTKNEFVCGYCHSVHGSDDEFMLSTSRQVLCLRCHKL